MNRTQALDSFWNSFGLSAYDEGTVPDKAKLPYITYNVASDDFNHPVALNASIWYRDKSWMNIDSKAEEVSNRIGLGGITVPYENGGMIIRKGSPFSQRVRDEDDSIRRIYINVEIEFIN